MSSSQVSSTRMILNVSAPSEQGLSLNKGEIFSGSVQSVKDGGLLTLLIKGRMIEAVTQVPVNTGEQLFLQVDGVRDGRVYLKLLTPQELQQAQSANLRSALLDMGINPGKENLIIAQALLDNFLPVTAENISSVSQGAVMLGGIQEENTQTAAFALSRGINIDQQMLPAVKQLLDSNSNLAKILDSLNKNINIMEEQAAQTGKPAESLAQSIKTPSGQVTNNSDRAVRHHFGQGQYQPRAAIIGTESVPIRDDTGVINLKSDSMQVPDTKGAASPRAGFDIDKSAWSRTGQAAVPKPGIDISGSSTTAVSSQDMKPEVPPPLMIPAPASASATLAGGGSSGAAAPRPIGMEDISEEVFRQLPFLKQILELITIGLSGGSQETVQKLEDILLSVKDVVRGLMLLEEIIKKEPELQNKTLMRGLLNRLEALERELSGPRIYNYSNRVSIDNHSSGYYFSIPVQIDQQTHLCELRLHKEPGKRSLKDQDNIKLAVSLETEKMGMVLFHINWQRPGSLDLQGVVERIAVQKHLKKNLDVLVDQLSNLGYKVNNQGIKVAMDPKDTASLKKTLLPTHNVKARTLAIDITI